MFDNATKNTWRGWAWNQIKDDVPVGSLVGVLAGDGGFDLDHGRKRGFEVFGIDCDLNCVQTFRSLGGVAIQDQARRQIALMKPDAFIFDAMGGFTHRSFMEVSYSLLALKAYVWNGLRGRDCSDFVEENRGNIPETPVYVKGRLVWEKTDKHRGKAVFGWQFMTWWTAAYLEKVYGEHTIKTIFDADAVKEALSVLNTRAKNKMALKSFATFTRPRIYSYESKDSPGVFYDSIAMRGLGFIKSLKCKPKPKSRKATTSIRKAAAAKALLTMQRQKN